MKQLMLLFLLFIVLSLSSCGVFSGSKLDGSYCTQMPFVGDLCYIFKSNGKVYQNVFGTEYEFDYKIEGNKVKMDTHGQGIVVFTLMEDGSIDGLMGQKFKKVKK